MWTGPVHRRPSFVLIYVFSLVFILSYLRVVSRLGDSNFSLNIKFIVFVLQLCCIRKNVRVTSRRLETGSTSSGSTLQEEV